MTPGEFTSPEQAHLNVEVRPRRAGYVFREDRVNDFLRCIRHASSRWGGQQEPIVPASASGVIQGGYLEVLETLEPDVVYRASEFSERALSRIEKSIRTQTQEVSVELRRSSGAHAGFVHAEQSLGHVRGGDANDVLSAAGAGLFTDWNDPSLWEFAASEVSTDSGAIQVACSQLFRSTLIAATVKDCGELAGWNMLGGIGVIHVAEAGSLKDAVFYWNIRALSPVGTPPTISVLTSLEIAKTPEFAEALHRKLRIAPIQTTPDITIISLSVKKPALVGLRRRLKLETHRGTTMQSHHNLATDPARKRSAALQVDPRLNLLGGRTSGVRAVTTSLLTPPRTHLRLVSPVVPVRGIGFVHVAISGSDHLKAPPVTKTAELFVPNARWNHGRLELLVQSQATFSFNVSLPTRKQVLEAFLDSRGIKATLSPAGQLAQGLLDRIGTDLKAFSDPGVHRVIRSLQSPRSKQLAAELERLLSSSHHADIASALRRVAGLPTRRPFYRLHDIDGRAQLSAPAASTALEALVETGLVERGFSISCPTCSLSDFVPLSQVSASAICTGCRSKASYEPSSKWSEPSIHYRLNSLLDRASDQGVLTHVYAASMLTPSLGASHLMLGADIAELKTGRHLGEVDILAVGATEVWAGEAKSSIREFTDEQLERDAKLSALIGASKHIMASLESVPDELRERAESTAQKHGLELVIYAPT